MEIAVAFVKRNGFDWDDGNIYKVCRHGLSIEIIEDFFSRKVLYLPDFKHSQNEDRLLAYGTTFEGRHLIVAYTMRNRNGENNIRVITARYMHKKEIEIYEEIKKAYEG